MANRKNDTPKEPALKRKSKSKGMLEATAEVIGSTLGAIAISTGLANPTSPPKQASAKRGKPPQKIKEKMPTKSKSGAVKKRGSKRSRPAAT